MAHDPDPAAQTAVTGVVLAAGAGRRFGSRKQLADLEGRPLAQHALDVACAAPELDRVVLVLGADAKRVRSALSPGRADVVSCGDWEEGIAASLRCGVDAAGDADWVVITLGDEPLLPAAAIARVVAAARAAATGVEAVRARWAGGGAGRMGHPVALGREIRRRVGELRGDHGARELLERARVLEVGCADLGDPSDVDTRTHLDALRAASPRG